MKYFETSNLMRNVLTCENNKNDKACRRELLNRTERGIYTNKQASEQ